MKYFKDQNNAVYAYEADGSQDAFIKPDLTPITYEEAQELISPPEPTFEEYAEMIRAALQSAIDAKARELGFSSGNALMLYAGKDNPFRPVADPFFAWEARVWAQALAYRNTVLSGQSPPVTTEQAVSMMPEYPA